MKQFERLKDYPEEIRGRWNSFIATEFDDSMTVEMQIRSYIKWIKANIDLTNSMVDYLNEFIETFDENLYQTINDIFDKWMLDGVFDELINEKLFQDLTNLINNVDKNLQNQINNLSPTIFGGTVKTKQELINLYPTGKEGIYIVADENAWYYWNGTSWTKGNDIPNSIPFYSIQSNKLSFVEAGSVNLFNKYTVTASALGSLGQEIASDTFLTSYFIKIDRINPIVCSSNVQSYACYDASFNTIKSFMGFGGSTFTPEENTRYIKVTIPKTRLLEFMLCYNNIPSKYVAYKEVIPKEFIGILTNENIKDGTITREKIGFYSKGTNIFNSEETIFGKYINPDNNNLIGNSAYNTTPFIDIEDSKATHISCSSARTVCFRDKNGGFFMTGFTEVSNPAPYTFEIPSGASSFAISYQVAYQDIFMVNYGQSLLPYQRYGFADKELFVLQENIIDDVANDIVIPSNLPKITGKDFDLYSTQLDYAYEFDYTGQQFTVNGVRIIDGKPTLNIIKLDGRTEKTRKLVTVNSKPLVQGNKRPLFVGDSYINGRTMAYITAGVNSMLNVVSQGTLTTSAGVKHEGRSGWTSGDYRLNTSKNGFTNAFYSANTNDFNFSEYCSKHSIDPTHVVWAIGINDMFSATTDEELNKRITTLLTNMRYFETNIKLKSTAIKVYFMNVPLPNANKQKFIDAYATQQSYERYCKNVYMINKALLESGLNIIPINIMLNDKIDMLDAIHPTNDGYQTLIANAVASRLNYDG